MTIEQLIAANTAALEANTAALLKSGGSTTGAGKTTGGSTAGAGKTTTTAKGPKNTRESMVAALQKVKEEKSKEEAKALISEVGGVEKMADIPEGKIDAVYDAAVKKLAEESAPEGGSDDI